MSQRKVSGVNMKVDDEKTLIAAVEKQTLLWEESQKVYRRLGLASRAWEHIACNNFQTRFTPYELKAKWTTLRNSFMRNLRIVRQKTIQKKTTGSGRNDDDDEDEEQQEYKPVWKHWEAMQFLSASAVHVCGLSNCHTDSQLDVTYDSVVNVPVGSQERGDYEDTTMREGPSSPGLAMHMHILSESHDGCGEDQGNQHDWKVPVTLMKSISHTAKEHPTSPFRDGPSDHFSAEVFVTEDVAKNTNIETFRPHPFPPLLLKQISSSSSTSSQAGHSEEATELVTPFRRPLIDQPTAVASLVDRADIITASLAAHKSPRKQACADPTMEAFGSLVGHDLTALKRKSESVANKVKFEVSRLIFEAHESLDKKETDDMFLQD